ncbi:hypothetical protein DB35_29180 [Streptomyces abyssalis]|uniref:DUF3040 domain-containing protein n=1 Tax=Streptomyces abyssalis TaxID=933944 RepID=A0A1E7JJZ8_9ACTN|nr:hypothetical protein [Streptomyces abyssalis]OEU85052.1 hypothetical protein DB35_29180 [Streptomyces abyssalis]OEU87974.1 hypothetical protein AN215_17215 [Streptomyces abyssalis]OEV28606.1 hypothetical protein AN219_20445 [Streptomyces nanshensis]
MDRFEDLPEQRGQDGAPGAGDRTAHPRGGRWRAAAWLVLVAAAVALVGGIVAGEGLLIAVGLVWAGISGHLFTPEYRNPRGRRHG